MSSNGFNKLYCAAEYFKGVDPTIVAPKDPMHTFFDGITRSEAAWLVYVLCKLVAEEEGGPLVAKSLLVERGEESEEDQAAAAAAAAKGGKKK